MNPQIQKLHNIAGKKTRLIIGLMSGTSLDGLDVALCKISGEGTETKVELLEFETHDYSEEIRVKIQTIFTKKTVELQQLTLLNAWIGNLHAAMILKSLKKWNILPEKIDAIASHGQTIYHAPKSLHGQEDFPNATLQIGDGDHIAVSTGIITLSDFRQKHIAGGGEGAPLAAYGDALIFSSEKENRIMLNIGGIANFTFLPKMSTGEEGDFTKILVTDTGPGNTLIDLIMKRFFNQPFDKNGAIAASGKIIPKLLAELKTHPFFKLKTPKTTGQELLNFSFLEKAIKAAAASKNRSSSEADVSLSENGSMKNDNQTFNSIFVQNLEKNSFTDLCSSVLGSARTTVFGEWSIADIIATLTRFSAETISEQILKLKKQAVIYSSGGGIHNPVLMKHLKELLPNFQFKRTDDLGILGDAKEAVLFAVLANQTFSGSPIKIADLPEVNFGKISFPK